MVNEDRVCRRKLSASPSGLQEANYLRIIYEVNSFKHNFAKCEIKHKAAKRQFYALNGRITVSV